MSIKTIYKKYFQKSKIFIYPLLDIKRGSPSVPTETYISWKENYNSEDIKLICLYKTTNDPEYVKFENEVLLKHNRLHDYIVIDDTTSLFIFDFSDMQNDWLYFIEGKYSKINDSIKKRILNYFNNNSANFIYVESYLFPNKFENEVLLKHNRLHDYIVIDDTTSLFIFDFSDMQNDWLYFIEGKYSKINATIKKRILNYFNNNSANFIYVESYLFPNKFYEEYANILNVDIDLLISVGELCTKPDLEKETLLAEVKKLENTKI